MDFFYNLWNTGLPPPCMMLTLKKQPLEALQRHYISNCQQTLSGRKFFSSHFSFVPDGIKCTTEYKAAAILCYKNAEEWGGKVWMTVNCTPQEKEPLQKPQRYCSSVLHQMFLMYI